MIDPEPNLYQRLGGYDVLAAFVGDIMPRLIKDPVLGVYWKGKSLGNRRREDQLLLEFLCAAFGGPATYLGRDMKTAHEGLGITDAEWAIFLRHLNDSLEVLAIGPREKAEFVAAAEGLKREVVEVSGPT